MHRRHLCTDYKVVFQRKDPIPYTVAGVSLKAARQTKKNLLGEPNSEFVSAKIYKETTYVEVEEVE